MVFPLWFFCLQLYPLFLCFEALILIGSFEGALWLLVLFKFKRFSKSFIFSSLMAISPLKQVSSRTPSLKQVSSRTLSQVVLTVF